MGYSYDDSRRLCCDSCGKAGGVTKRRCPFGYCPPPAYCDDCAEKLRDRINRQAHIKRGCLERHTEYVNLENERAEMYANGEYVRCSALGVAPEVVHVLFKREEENGDGYIGKFMGRDTYHKIPLLANATPADYEALGELDDAPGNYS